MGKILLILRYEIVANITRKSFLLMVFGLPAIVVVGFLVDWLLTNGSPDLSGGSNDRPKAAGLQVEGYVDWSGLIKTIPEDIPEGALVPFEDEVSAHDALSAGEINAYYVIPRDYVAKGDLIWVNPGYRLTGGRDESWVMEQTLFANLLGNDEQRIARARLPMDLQVRPLATIEPHERGGKLAFYLPYATMLIFAFVVLGASGLLLHSLAKEKQNCVMEILLLSVSPHQLLAGKVIALGIMGLLQAVIWLATGYALLHLGGQALDWPLDATPPPSVLAWGFVFFMLAYVVYASLAAGLGALVPSTKEGSQVSFLIIWPWLLPLLFIGVLTEEPHGALATTLSLFPLTSPAAMMARLAIGGVPWWQPWLAAALMLATAYLTVRAVARAFHAQAILSGQPFSLKRYIKAMRGIGEP